MKTSKVIAIVVGISFLQSSVASACLFPRPKKHEGHHVRDHYDGHHNDHSSRGGHGSKKTTILQCGDVITEDTIMGNDLYCPDVTGFVLQVENDSITFDGNGHTITAPQAAAGVFVEGDSVKIKG